MLKKLLKKTKYVRELEKQLTALNDMYEQETAAGRIERRFLQENIRGLQEKLKDAEKEYRDLNTLTACIISEPHTIYGTGSERHINITRREFEAAAGLEVEQIQRPPYASYVELRVKVNQ